MAGFILRRLFAILSMLWLVWSLVFVVGHLLPGRQGELYDSPQITREDEARLRRVYGLDAPLPVQYLRQFTATVRGVQKPGCVAAEAPPARSATTTPKRPPLRSSASSTAVIRRIHFIPRASKGKSAARPAVAQGDDHATTLPTVTSGRNGASKRLVTAAATPARRPRTA